MSKLVAERINEPWKRRLYLPAYEVGVSARYAQIPAQTVSRWHHTTERFGPAVSDRQARRPLSYLQLIELAVVSTFRHMGLSLQRIRKAREFAQQRFGFEYPFAEYEFKTGGYHLLMELDDFEPGQRVSPLILADRAGQLGWKEAMEEKLDEFEYEFDLALIWHVAGKGSTVRIDPRVSFGAPIVGGVPTWVLRGRWDAGESIPDMKADFPGLTDDAINDALRFEGRLNGVAA